MSHLRPNSPDLARRGRVLLGALVSLLCVLAVGGVALATIRGWSPWAAQRTEKFLTVPAQKGSLSLIVTERGSLDSASNVTLLSQVEGSTTIISIVPEGTKVEKGQVLVELDSATLRDTETQQRIALEQAQAALKQASETLEIQKTQNDSDLAAAALKLKLAELDLRKYEDGEYSQERNLILNEQKLAEEDLTRADEKYKFSKRLSKKGYVTQSELEADRIAMIKARIAKETADEKLKVFDQYAHQRKIEELKANAVEFKREVDRTRRKGVAALAQAEADLAKCKLTAEVEGAKMEKLKQQIAACTMKAPQAGEVVYANQNDRRGNNEAVIEEGAQVRERQAIINLPDYTRMQVKARVHESRISSVSAGLSTLIRVDASPGKVYHGVVDTVSSVPLSGSWPNRDLKEYAAIVKLTDPVEQLRGLKPGLTAQVEIHVERLESVLQVPVQAVVELGGNKFVYVANGDKTEQRAIEAGRTNDVMVQVLESGSQLREGELVVLNPQSLLPKDLPAAPKDDEAAPPVGPNGEHSPETGKPAGKSGPPGDSPRKPTPSAEDSLPKNPETAGGPPRTDGPPRGRPDPAAMFARFDANADGKLTADELPDRMQPMHAQLDANADGGIDKDEWQKASSMFRGRRS